jgi:class 3 adenylate cyclase
MDPARQETLKKLAKQRLSVAYNYLEEKKVTDELKTSINEEAEIPGFENKPMKFGQFVNKEFVAMMTDIRKSTDIINRPNGTRDMFLIFYAYSAVTANIVDHYNGTSTEFLGDGVINLFDTDKGLDEAFKNSIRASREILAARDLILNPLFQYLQLPTIDLGIGIDHGVTIVTRFGYKTDNDLKAFGSCVYNASKLSKGMNEIIISEKSKVAWPSSTDGKLQFSQTILKEGLIGYKTII